MQSSADRPDGPAGVATNLLELLEERAASPRGGYTFLKDGRTVAAELSYSELVQRARAIAAQLARQRIEPGSRALLLYPPGLSFLPVFFGCLYAGVVAVPVPPPDGARLRSTLPRLLAILEDAEPALVLTISSIANELEERLKDSLPGLLWMMTDEPDAAPAEDWLSPQIDPHSLAYLQYTSGSTAAPRGVMISHSNVLHNLECLKTGFAYEDDSISLNWMPHFHDYGLVDGLLQPLYSNIPSLQLSPLTFLKRPLRWLEAISHYRATHSHGPNFAYESCLQRITPEQREGLDLSCWKVACNGAEPVRADTLRRFSETFGPCGFRPETFYPGFGLAESTLFVTAKRHGRPPHSCLLQAEPLEHNRVVPLEMPNEAEAAREVMSCGSPQGGVRVRIVDPETRCLCPPGRIGEIWIEGRSVALGYWAKPEETRTTFQARLAGDTTETNYLRTGDLGFIRDEELYVTGRLKDLIIIGGVNHYPQDIEWSVQSHCPELRRDRCAAFSIERDGEEQLVVIAEPEQKQDDWTPLIRRIREAVAREHELSVAAVALLKRGGILKTSSGKLQRSACRRAFLDDQLAIFAMWQSESAPEPASTSARPNVTELQQWLCQQLAVTLRLAPHEIDLHAPFAEYGLDSRSGVALVSMLEDWLGGEELSPALLWQYPSVSALCEYLSNGKARTHPSVAIAAPTVEHDESVAIVGLACRLPGAASADEFWKMLCEGRSAIVPSPRLPNVEGGFLASVEDFDADFFGISASEAQAMDPQQRLLLEVAWEALENAGLSPQNLAGLRGGVFIGISAADFALQQFSRSDAEALIGAHSGTGLAFSVAANRLSYYLNLHGPSMAIDTACSSSLVAVHQAVQSLKSGECDMALAGGVNLILNPHLQLALERAGMLSPSQRCKTFDADADGYVRGEGCGLVVLKRLTDAERDGDTILSLIRASGVNQDGRSNGLTAPNPSAQQALISDTLAQAGLSPRAIDYIEAHGTGTRLGDPIEMSALQAVLADGRRADERCLVGAVKANIGHLEAAAGIAGLIKTVLALQHGQVPPQPNLRRLNPLIKVEGSPLAIAERLQAWPQNTDGQAVRPRRAGVSSFGFGGTNAHVILEEATHRRSSEESQAGAIERPRHLFTLSAHSDAALRELAGRYAAFLTVRPDTSLEDLCYTTAVGRAHLVERLAMPARSTERLASDLQAFAQDERVAGLHRGRAATQQPGVVFLFSGQGAQYAGMARQLYETQPLFRSILHECVALINDELERPLLSVIFDDSSGLIDQTAYTQPALFVVEYALARLWQEWGIKPAAVMGHSLGEYVAACLAGVFSLPDALKLVTARGRLIQQLPLNGTMLAVLGDESRVREVISDSTESVSVAAVNAPQNIVLSGDRRSLVRLNERLSAEGMTCRFLQVSHAFHSPLMTPILEEFHALAAGLDYARPSLTWVSNLFGGPMLKAPDADYWTRHVRDTVRFADGINYLGQSHRLFLEIGPRPVLSRLGAQCLSSDEVQWLPSLQQGADEWTVLLDSLARLYVTGVTPDWRAFDRDYRRQRLNGLPNYPFERRRFALPPLPPGEADAREVLRSITRNEDATGGTEANLQDEQERPNEVSDWGYVPSWHLAPPIVRNESAEWLLLTDGRGVGSALQSSLEEHGHTCQLTTATTPEMLPAGAHNSFPLHVVCLWGLDWPTAASLEATILSTVLEQHISRLLSLLHSMANQTQREIRLWLVTHEAVALPHEKGEGVISGLLQSLLWGLGRALRSEYPDWKIRLVDLDGETPQASEQLLQECLSKDAGTDVCWRGEHRYTWRLEQQRLERAAISQPLGETWLVTGGLGDLGLMAAEWLVSRGVRHLLLVGRRPPSPEAQSRLSALKEQGAAVKIGRLDVSDYEALRSFLSESQSGWPPLKGLIHAAGVRDDGILHQQTASRFNAVLAPKVLGGWNLHLLTEHTSLRHFVLFSSASSLLGNAGQSAYAAANAFLDALAGYRHARDMAALSLNWSAWAKAADDARVAAQLERHGLAPIADDAGLEALERALALGLPQVALLPVRTGHSISQLAAERTANEATAKKSAVQDAETELFGLLQHLPSQRRKPELERYILGVVASILGRDPESLDAHRGFFELGLDSLNVVELRNRLQREMGRPLPVTLPFDYSTAATLADELLRRFGLDAPSPGASVALSRSPSQARTDGIAIIGMGCRLPGGVSSPEEFWSLLREGVDAISEVPRDRWDMDSFYHPDPDHPGTIVTRHGGFLDAVEEFDAIFFGISPREAVHLDPQQRLLLEVCWRTFEHAGMRPSRLSGTQTGVFIGISTNDYLRRLNRRPEEIDAYIGTGNALSLAANRLSYIFGLEGPSLAIDTACSSSLTAIHQACLSLREGECDMAISGGVNLLLDPTVSINHSRAHMLAPDGRCKPFSAEADGMVRSEGCALVLLKRLSDAIRDNDTVYAVIRGSAVNQDGRTSGLTVPKGPAQQRVIRRALQQASLEPSAISYVEAHGTGTALGDPIEADALTAVFGQARERLVVGSVKSNLGHLESAAGIAGLMKTVLALQHRSIPPHLHCTSLSPRIDWAHSPLWIPRSTEEWPNGKEPRRAGVSSFGFGGTNAHAILEEAPEAGLRVAPSLSRYLLPLSAKTETALRLLAQRFVAYLETAGEHPADICYTAACGRDHFTHRIAVVGDSATTLRDRLDDWLNGKPNADIWTGNVSTTTSASASVQTPQASGALPSDWAKMAERYVLGVSPDWDACYSGLNLIRVVLPGHPFERQNYSVSPPASLAPTPQSYRLEWVADDGVTMLPSRLSERWLILADERGWGETVAAELEGLGARCTVVHRASASNGRRSIQPDDEEALRAMLAEATTLHGILYLWSLDSPAPALLNADDLMEAERQSLGTLLHLIQALNDLQHPPRLWLFTRGAQSVLPEDRLEGLVQTPLWGMGRTLPLELPWLWGGLLDLPEEGPTPQDARAVCGFLYQSGEDSQRALRNGRFFVPRLHQWRPERPRTVSISAEASYLITGGFGSLGRQLGRWLIERGARNIWLMGRSGANEPAARAYLEELKAAGVAVRVAAVDVTAASAVTARLNEWRRSGPPLRGVFHAAGTNAESQLTNVDWKSFAAILAPKIQGAWALQQSTADAALDFFVNCSSIAGLWGSQRQAHYSAANAFLDGFAAYRQARGQAGLSINWGPLTDSAMLNEAAAAELHSFGIEPTPISQATNALSSLMNGAGSQVAHVAVNWERFVPLYRSRSTTALFNALTSSDQATGIVSQVGVSGSSALSPSMLRAWLAEQLSATLNLPPQRLDADLPLPRLGLDSLMAVQLRNRLQQQLGLDVQLSELLGELSLNELVTMLAPNGQPETVKRLVEPVVQREWVTGEI